MHLEVWLAEIASEYVKRCSFRYRDDSLLPYSSSDVWLQLTHWPYVNVGHLGC